MRIMTVCLLACLFGAGCGWKESNVQYYKAVQESEVARMSAEKHRLDVMGAQEFVRMDLDDQGRVKSFVVGNPAMLTQAPIRMRNIAQPKAHPAWGVVSSVVTSPVLGVVAQGWAVKEIIKASTGDSTTNTTSDSQNTSSKTDASVVTTSSTDNSDHRITNTSSDSSDHSTSTTSTDSSNNSVTTTKTSDSSDNSVATSETDSSDSSVTTSTDSSNHSVTTSETSDSSDNSVATVSTDSSDNSVQTKITNPL